MSVTVHEVLGRLRETALDKRDKGDKFERLVVNFLRTDPEWVKRFYCSLFHLVPSVGLRSSATVAASMSSR